MYVIVDYVAVVVAHRIKMPHGGDMTANDTLDATYAALRSEPNPRNMTVGTPVYLLPSKYGNDTYGIAGLEIGEVISVGSDNNYEVETESYGDPIHFHAQRLRRVA